MRFIHNVYRKAQRPAIAGFAETAEEPAMLTGSPIRATTRVRAPLVRPFSGADA